MTASSSTRRTWWKSVLGVVFTLVMLFPVYWMVNVSFTATSDLRRTPPQWFPWDPTFDGYAAVFAQQLPA
ncbi:MAG TPA: carbohydrate ABC transporter permease, partial [Candidatus Agrococcus pullicola]|nr:carbohydrate ABC transporter permease [Candidatus Agrococcus pullicola]